MEGFINKIGKIIDGLAQKLVICNVSQLKGARFIGFIKIIGKGQIKKITISGSSSIAEELNIIIDGKDETNIPLFLNGVFTIYNASNMYFILDEPIPFNTSFEIKTKSNNTSGNVIYTLE